MSQAHVPAQPPAPPVEASPSAANAPPEEEMPKRFGKYTLLRRLALGGMAELFLGLQRSMAGFEKLIVIKRVLPQLAKDTEFVTMLLDEARIAATLNHPNVAHIYDVGVFEGQYFIAMEHIHGEDLRSIVRQMRKKEVSSFPLEHALAIVLGCCAGLAYAHEKRDLDGEPLDIVHRDVSPQNILVTFSGDVKLVDFGIAKAGRSELEETKSGKLKGKIPYMSPEQAQGNVLDARSDIFSLGVILFELCTGRRLFKGTSEFDTMRLIVDGEYPSPKSINPHLPDELEHIIVRALAKDVNERYQSARELQADLESLIRSERLAVSPLSLGEWMQSLFSEKLAQQKQMLQEGRQLAEVIAAQVAEEEAEAKEALASGVHRRKASRVPWILLALVLLAGAAVGAWLLTRPPPTGTRSGPGVIEVTSDPPGAAIWLDGDRLSERTPATLRDLPVGAKYTVKLASDGFAPFTTEVDLTAEAPNGAVTATLERPSASSYAVVNLHTVPAGASILFDGADTGKTTPAAIPEIEPSVEHTLALALEGYVTKTVPITLRAGQVEDLSFELERLPLTPNEAIVRITTTPEDARIEVDGTTYETGSPYELRLPAHAIRLVVAKSGYRDDARTVELPGGEVTEVAVELERVRRGPRTTTTTTTTPTGTAEGPGKLTFDARPWCQVSIDGTPVGQTPIVNRTLPSGSHRVTCTNPELGASRTVTVQIRAGETTRQRIDLQ